MGARASPEPSYSQGLASVFVAVATLLLYQVIYVNASKKCNKTKIKYALP
jgi:hypothetical protein